MRAKTRFELLGVGVAVVAIMSSGDAVHTTFVLVFGAAALLGLWVWLGVGIGRCAARLRVLEAELNRTCEPPAALAWESQQAALPRWKRLIP